ncbi:hypothetical protein CEXT_69121 [Caerostris extrusa]|uniref:Uncharacterized protein n=1 Tax=Caerostris extrusa TaxID=172846 RepID=A0AAV4TRA5_CAEEX|nr:hypothetical protein CEXT_69121 [Caerostris extrusa]
MYAIQDLGRYSLSTILFEKKQAIFTKYFVEAIYAFNCFPAPNVDAIATFMKNDEKICSSRTEPETFHEELPYLNLEHALIIIYETEDVRFTVVCGPSDE